MQNDVTSVRHSWTSFPRGFQPTNKFPSLRKASHSNPRPLFQTACKMMSRQCVVAGPVSAKKAQMYTTYIEFSFKKITNNTLYSSSLVTSKRIVLDFERSMVG